MWPYVKIYEEGWRLVIEPSRKSLTVVLKDDFQVIYNLIFKNALYSLECFVSGSTQKDVNHYYLAENITDDEGEAEMFLRKMAKGKVLPVHIKDMVEDYFINQ